MKKLLLLLLFCSVFIPALTQSTPVDTNVFKYMPLKLGNAWVYVSTAYMYYSRFKNTITGTIVQNNHLYYNLVRVTHQGYKDSTYQRIDTVSGNIVTYSTSSGCSWMQNSVVRDSLLSNLGDSCKCNNHKCTNIGTYTIFGTSRSTKTFSWYSGFEAGFEDRYAQNIGWYYQYRYGGTGGTTTNIIGCVIDGIVYGDTNLVGIKQISSEVPQEFSLSQNYPNPFNPSTVISFQLAHLRNGQAVNSFVSLKVYDLLGREVETLVNEQLQPGTYEVDFDGTNYPSGVYYYKLSAGDYSETRKMVLIK